MPRKSIRSATPNKKGTRKLTRQSTQNGGDIPNVYADMLAEAASSESNEVTQRLRAVKRRKVEQFTHPEPESADKPPEVNRQPTPLEEPVKTQPIIYDDFEGSDESDVEFEDVDLEAGGGRLLSDDDQPEQRPLQIDLSTPIPKTPSRTIIRHKPLTKAERDMRLDVHKWHVLSLIIHGHTRSLWCDDEVLHVALKQLVPRKTISLLHVDETHPSYQRNHSFTKGIEDLCAIWKQAWTITERGLRRPYWKEGVDAQEEFDQAEDPIDLDDFRLAARDRQGSRDLGAQLFTALLRSLALEARLVFSLQVLPFSGVARGQTPEKPKASYIEAGPQVFGSSGGATPRRKKIRDSAYPVFWTEVLNPVTSAWIALDPLVRDTINKPKTQFEPPASDVLNQMTYVIAFEDDHTIRDVTQRYVQWFNAKTRKFRIESTKGGMEWWKKAMRVFRRGISLPRDAIEDEYLAQRSAAEGMPKSVQDFKHHPVYVLERHLRSNEVIYPRREVGKFSAGTTKSAKVESVYRAQDVYVCRTADAWYRRGRDIKLGEQPLKRAVPKIMRDELPNDDDDGEEAREGVALYAEFQTAEYQPPPVERGRIPKNAYGNLDIYVPSMIPAGAVHINHPLASQAAKVLEVSYADAVTGFVFRGRQGTAVISGVVVAVEFTAAMIATIEGLEWLGTQEVQAARTKIILGIWKRMLTALRIHEKIQHEYGEREESEEDSTYADEQFEDAGGGFMLEANETEEKVAEQDVNLSALKTNLPSVLPDEVVLQSIKITISPHTVVPETYEAVGALHQQDFPNHARDEDIFGPDEDTEGGGFVPAGNEGGFLPEDGKTSGGGFSIEKDEGGGGGFIHEDHASPPLKLQIQSAKSEHDKPVSGFVADVNERSITPLFTQRLVDSDRLTAGGQEDDKPDQTGSGEFSEHVEDHDQDEKMAGHQSDVSLLSHDPAEDDDEPEWLEDAFDSE